MRKGKDMEIYRAFQMFCFWKKKKRLQKENVAILMQRYQNSLWSVLFLFWCDFSGLHFTKVAECCVPGMLGAGVPRGKGYGQILEAAVQPSQHLMVLLESASVSREVLSHSLQLPTLCPCCSPLASCHCGCFTSMQALQSEQLWGPTSSNGCVSSCFSFSFWLVLAWDC